MNLQRFINKNIKKLSPNLIQLFKKILTIIKKQIKMKINKKWKLLLIVKKTLKNNNQRLLKIINLLGKLQKIKQIQKINKKFKKHL